MTDATHQELEIAANDQSVVDADVNTADVSTEKSEAAKKKPQAKKRLRLSRQEQIQQQANPATRLSGQQKTIQLPFSYKSDIMHEYIQLYQSKMLDAYERLKPENHINDAKFLT